MVSQTSLSTSVVAGDSGHIGHSNTVHTAVNGLTATAQKTFSVREYGAVGDGATNDTAAFTAAAAAMVSAGSGVLYLGTGTYKVTTLPTLSPSVATGPLTYAVRGDGSDIAIINHYGTSASASLTVRNSSFDPDTPSTGAPMWSGFTIDGTNTSGGCCGLIWGDVSYGSFSDVQVKNFASGDGFFFNNPYGWTEGINMRGCRSEYNSKQLHFDVGSGRTIGTITTTLTSSSSYTTIAVSGGLSEAVSSGQQLVIAANTSAIGVTTQTVTTSASAAQGATSISVTSFTAATTYTSGTAKVYFGSYGSFDYWTVDSIYLQANADQHGIVSEISRGLGSNMQRIGTRLRCTGNFHTGGSNSGVLFWIKGDDTWNDTDWGITCEADGSGTAHQSVAITSTTGAITGNGLFSAYGFTTASFTGGTYQFGVSGMVCVAGISDTSTGLVFRQMQRPGFLDVASGVDPGGYTTGATGVAWQNTTGYDLFVTVPFAFTGAATVAWNVDVWNGLPAGSTVAAGPSGITIPITFVHYNRMWARMDWTNATKGTVIARYIN